MKYSAGGMLAEGSAFDPVFTRDAVNFIHDPHELPFYLVLSLINPHDICKVLGGKVKGATFADAIFFCRDENEPYLRFQDRPELPANHAAPILPGMIRHRDYMYEELAGFSEDDWRRYIAAYQLLIENADWHIHLTLEALDQAGLAEDTLVVFTTDHGDMMGSHALISKTTFYEESAKTLLFLRQPGVIPARSADHQSLTGTIDLMPTILDLCSIDIPENLDGKSFNPRSGGHSEGDFSYLFSENFDGRMLRLGAYKYIRSQVYGQEHDILFDLGHDPDETRNVFGHPGHEPASAELRAKLQDWCRLENIGLKFDQESPPEDLQNA